MMYQKQLETRYQVAVLVAGGGAAGVTAAVAAARMGKKVLLCESMGCFGGVGTSGMVPSFAPFYDGVNMLCSGIGLEIRKNVSKHIPLEQYGNLQWVEEERSSCCEMVVDFYNTFKDELVLDSEGATHLYTGMVTDSGRFKYSGVSGETMRCAGTLLDIGVDTDTLFARLYLEAFEYLKFKAHIYQKMQITPNGVAYIVVDREMQKQFGLTQEMASACVGNLDSIRGCISWIAFIETGDAEGSIRVRLRSRFVHINSIAEKYHGGGHACASGATVYSQEELEALLADTDAVVKEYKETHEGWL